MAMQGSSLRLECVLLFFGVFFCLSWGPALASRPYKPLQEAIQSVESVVAADGDALPTKMVSKNQRRSDVSSSEPPLDPLPAASQSGEQRGSARSLLGYKITWPSPSGWVKLQQTIHVYGDFNGNYKMYYGLGDGSDKEAQPPIFMIHPGGTVRNVIIGTPAGDGINCRGSCKIINVWWTDVGEDAATLRGNSPNQVMEIIGGGARGASDKVFQHNGPGTVIIRDFWADNIGKLYRACGSCPLMKRHVVVENVFLSNVHTAVAGINVNSGDTGKFKNININQAKQIDVCQKYRTGSGWSTKLRIGGGPDGNNCFFDPTTVKFSSGGNPSPQKTSWKSPQKKSPKVERKTRKSKKKSSSK
eukprot:TRINITY_DN14339_c0_g2_i1.p1 TRINITY_DN14339_c0_g2~~TRINITY_DN14339_c0_g2_i1.p1  ORF type:complete len:359 (+),score=67.19 TRINITY_DN14339_c0_g2_i1:130-1206(+)